MFTQEIKRSRSKRPLVIALVMVVVVGAMVLLVPFPRTVKSTFKLEPIATTDVVALRAGTIVEVVAAEGSRIERGATIAKYDTADAEKKLKDLEAQLEAAQKKLKAAGAKGNKAQAAVTKAEAAAKAAQLALEKAEKAAKGKKTPALAAAQKKADAAAAALKKAKDAAGPSAADLEKEIASTNDAITALKAEIAAPTLVAPASGQLSGLTLKKGDAVEKDAKVARVDDTSKLKAVVKVPAGEPVTKGQQVELVLEGGKKLLLFDADAAGGSASAEFQNAKGELKSGLEGEAEIAGEQRSLLSRSLSR